MKTILMILTCVSVCAMSCKQKTTQKEEIPTQENTELSDMKLCQSCGMPLTEGLFGTNADSTLNEEYCKYCYVAGAFAMPDATMSEMIDVCIPFMVEQGFSAEDSRKAMEELLPTLKRWKQD
jgi:nitrous oxide reductase accessory protein NosL